MISDVVLLVLTRSRGLIAALGISFAFILFASGRKKYAMLLVILALALFSPRVISLVSSTFMRTAEEVRSDNTRVYLIQNGLQMTLNSLGFGIGCGQIPYWLENYAQLPTGGLRALHNWWVEILASFGIGIFIGYIAFYYRLFRDFLRTNKKTSLNHRTTLYLVICAIMAGYIIGSISSSSNFINETLWIFWALCIGLQGTISEHNEVS